MIEAEKPGSRRDFSRRIFLGSLATGAMSLAWFSARPLLAHARSASTALTRSQTLYSYKGQPGFVQNIDWSPDGSRIVSAGGTSVIGGFSARSWNALTGGQIVEFVKTDDTVVWSARWSPDGQRVASGTSQYAQIWDAVSGEPVLTYTGHTNPYVLNVEWSPDGTRCASSCITSKGAEDYRVHVWDAQTATLLFTYDGHTTVVTALAWSPGGAYIASESDDKTVQVWDAQTGALVVTYTRHTSSVLGLAWSPDSGRIASASAGLPDREAPLSSSMLMEARPFRQVFRPSIPIGAWQIQRSTC